jgi:hypothetical protein
VGCGYLDERVGKCLVERGDKVFGTVRSAVRAGQLDHLGIEPLIAEVIQPESLDALSAVERVLYCVGFDRCAGIARRVVSIVGLKSKLREVLGVDLAYPDITTDVTAALGLPGA